MEQYCVHAAQVALPKGLRGQKRYVHQNDPFDVAALERVTDVPAETHFA